jgi:hypothetical protein
MRSHPVRSIPRLILSCLLAAIPSAVAAQLRGPCPPPAITCSTSSHYGLSYQCHGETARYYCSMSGWKAEKIIVATAPAQGAESIITTSVHDFLSGAIVAGCGPAWNGTEWVCGVSPAFSEFGIIAAPSGTSPVADVQEDTLTLTAGQGISITGDSATDTVDFAATDATGATAGVIRLAGDLGGTASSPTVVGVQCGSACIGDAELVADYSGIGACGANTFASTLNDNAAPTCTQPSFAGLSGTATDGQIPDSITIDLAAVAATLAGNGANCSGNNFALGVDASGGAECAQPSLANLSASCADTQVVGGNGAGTALECQADDDVPDAGDFAALALTGDVTSSGLATTIGSDRVLEPMLKVVNAGSDEDCLTKEVTTGDFEWQPCGGGSTPSGTGFRHVTAGAEDAAAKLVDTADVNDAQITYAKIQDVSAASKILGRGDSGSGDVQEIALGANLSMSGTTLNAAAGSGNSVEVSINLGTEGGLIYTATVTGQSWVLSTSEIVCTPHATSADGLTVETVLASGVQAIPSNLVAATGFDLTIYSPHGATGTYRVHCVGV